MRKPDRQKEPGGRKRLLAWLLPVVTAVILAGACSRFFYQLMLIQGDSMLPAYHHLQPVILDKRADAFGPGDVIAFRCGGLNAVLVKRIIAGPGDEAVIRDGTLYVNGEKSEAYPAEGTFGYAGLLAQAARLADGQYLVIGDNVAESRDSRYPEVGTVNRADILGRVIE